MRISVTFTENGDSVNDQSISYRQELKTPGDGIAAAAMLKALAELVMYKTKNMPDVHMSDIQPAAEKFESQ